MLTFEYGEVVPDSTVDTFCNVVQKCLDNDESFDEWVDTMLKLNGNKIPAKVQELIDKHTENGINT